MGVHGNSYPLSPVLADRELGDLIAEVQSRQVPAERGGISRGIMRQIAGRRSGEVLAR
jgi:hypothetical protein